MVEIIDTITFTLSIITLIIIGYALVRELK